MFSESRSCPRPPLLQTSQGSRPAWRRSLTSVAHATSGGCTQAATAAPRPTKTRWHGTPVATGSWGQPMGRGLTRLVRPCPRAASWTRRASSPSREKRSWKWPTRPWTQPPYQPIQPASLKRWRAASATNSAPAPQSSPMHWHPANNNMQLSPGNQHVGPIPPVFSMKYIGRAMALLHHCHAPLHVAHSFQPFLQNKRLLRGQY
jgi:hypothetical protein